jgi:hypothetical protein
MPVAYNKIFQEVANMLGAVAGSDATAAEANYVATLSSSTVVGPDFTLTMITDAVVGALDEIVKALSETPRHPDRAAFLALSGNLASGAALPTAISAVSVLGILNRVIDSSDSRALIPAEMDKVRSYLRFSSTIYAGLDPYWYVIDGNTILHTRSNVKVEAFCWNRPASFSGNIPVPDQYERVLVCGAVSMLANKEGQYAPLGAACAGEFLQGLAAIRSLGRPENYGGVQVAPPVE